MLAVKLLRRQGHSRHLRRREGFADRADDLLGFAGLDQDLRDAARPGEPPDLLHEVDGGVEDHTDVRCDRLAAQLVDKFVAVHVRHQDVGDDQVGRL